MTGSDPTPNDRRGSAGAGLAAPPPNPSARVKSARTGGTAGTPARASADGVSTGATATPDGLDPALVRLRWIMGWLLMGGAAVIAITMTMPWIAVEPDLATGTPESLSGWEWENGITAAVLAIALGVYGWQGVARSEMKFDRTAMVLVAMLVGIVIFGFVEVSNGTVERLGLEPAGTVENEGSLENTAMIETRIGSEIAMLASLVMIVPIAALFRDRRRRRKRDELANAVVAEAKQRKPPPPPPPGAARGGAQAAG